MEAVSSMDYKQALISSDEGPHSKTVAFLNYGSYLLMSVCETAGQMLTCGSEGGSSVKVMFGSDCGVVFVVLL